MEKETEEKQELEENEKEIKLEKDDVEGTEKKNINNNLKSSKKKERKPLKIKVIALIILILAFIIIFVVIYVKNHYYVIEDYKDYNVVEYYYSYYQISFLNTKGTSYLLLDDYDEYNEMAETIDVWAEDTYQEAIVENKAEIAREEIQSDIEELSTSIKNILNEGNYDKTFFEENSLLLVEDYTEESVLHNMELKYIKISGYDLNIYFNKSYGGLVAGGQGMLYFITLDKDIIENIKNINIDINGTNTSVEGVSYKPIIYLYPEEETEVEVILGYEELITCSYPEYEESWNVLAYPNGDLVYLDTDRILYSLYYESTNAIEFEVEDEGFVVAREDIAEFLEEKLAILGLTEREAEEFIIYWLPVLQENEYTYIRFATAEEIEENMPLEISPTPDTLIRVLMTYKGLDEPIEVKEQELETVERKGFVAVEWGGTEIE